MPCFGSHFENGRHLGQVHGARKERRIRRIRIIIIIRNGAKTISIQTLFGRLNNNKKRSKNNKSPKLCLGDLINYLT